MHMRIIDNFKIKLGIISVSTLEQAIAANTCHCQHLRPQQAVMGAAVSVISASRTYFRHLTSACCVWVPLFMQAGCPKLSADRSFTPTPKLVLGSLASSLCIVIQTFFGLIEKHVLKKSITTQLMQMKQSICWFV